MDFRSERHEGCRIIEYTHRKQRMISLQNEKMRISILLDKGADIVEILDKQSDIDLMWKTPNGLREYPNYIQTCASSEGNFHDYYPGGWQLILPAGGPMNYYGVDIGLHGEACLLAWDFCVLKDEAEEIIVRLWTQAYRTPYRISRTLSLRAHQRSFFVTEEVHNQSDEDLDLMWGNHPAVGEPFLSEHCLVDLPARKFVTRNEANNSSSVSDEHNWPFADDKDFSKLPAKDSKTLNIAFITELEEGWFAVRNPQKKLGYGISFDRKVFPYLWYWQVARGHRGFPWYSSTYSFALEFWSSYPSNFDTAKQNGTLSTILAHQTIETSYRFILFDGSKKVQKIEANGDILFEERTV